MDEARTEEAVNQIYTADSFFFFTEDSFCLLGGHERTKKTKVRQEQTLGRRAITV